ncbi:PKD domain-containing protein, partial [Candidatus Bipolaricaulota bacterium]|nr:PKD domain-containing protein [Candidatus Bipolaricaulota bacterium]
LALACPRSRLLYPQEVDTSPPSVMFFCSSDPLSYTHSVKEEDELEDPRLRPERRPVLRLSSAPRHGHALRLVLILVLVFAIVPFAENTEAANAESDILSPSIVISPTLNVHSGDELHFDASASAHSVLQELVDEVRYIWDFADGNVLIGGQVSHRYFSAGVFQVSLTMEVFENGGVFHRATATQEVRVLPAELHPFATVINLGTGFTSPGVLIISEGPFVFIGQQGSETIDPIVEVDGPGEPPDDQQPELELRRFVVSGGLLSVGDLRLCDARIAMELADEKWLAFVGFGTNVTETAISLTELYPNIERRGYELVGEIDQANLITLGVGYELATDLYLIGSVGSLYIAGTYEGSSRLILDDALLSAPFSDWRGTLSFGLGLRIGWGMLSLQVLLTL